MAQEHAHQEIADRGPHSRDLNSAELSAELSDYLTRSGKLDARGLQRAQRATEGADERFMEALAQLGIVSEQDLAGAIAVVTGLPLAQSRDYPQAPVLGDVLSYRFLRDALAVPLEATDDAVVIALANPANGFTKEAVELATGRSVLVKIGTPSDILAGLSRVYSDGHHNARTDKSNGHDGASDVDIDRLRDLASEAPIVKFVDQLIARAGSEKASDIHIEPFEDRVRVRYRIDGRLQEVDSLPYGDRLPVVSRIKILAGLNIAERRQPQDGRIQSTIGGRPIDIRVATAPTLHGESIVLRLLHRDHTGLDLSELGFESDRLKLLYRALDRPHGLILVTGPTGSGKTTTLYAALNRLNVVDRKILTVEDPIEYQLPGVNQVQVNSRLNLGFANILRSFLRHDPDVIMVGEIRDAETAEIAVHAALTGHLVLATLHTNDASSAITRLIEMGVQDFLVTSTVIAVVGQRLVRKLCPQCRAPTEGPARSEAAQESKAFTNHFIPKGCNHCHGTGFSGRTTISEVAFMDEALRRIVLDRAEAKTIQEAAVRNGMETMLSSGIAKVRDGVTTTEEVLRVTSEA